MMAFLRTLPNTLWWITLFLAVVAFFTQIGIAVARSGAVSLGSLLAEFIFTLVFLAIPLGIADGTVDNEARSGTPGAASSSSSPWRGYSSSDGSVSLFGYRPCRLTDSRTRLTPTQPPLTSSPGSS